MASSSVATGNCCVSPAVPAKFNWDTALVPDATTDVVIAAAPNQPSSYIFDPSCKGLTIQSDHVFLFLARIDRNRDKWDAPPLD